MPDALEDGSHRARPNPETHATVVPTVSRDRLNFILENLNLGVGIQTMNLDGNVVDVLTYTIVEESLDDEGNPIEEYLYEPLAVFVTTEIEGRLSPLPEED